MKPVQETAAHPRRIAAIDAARGVALVAMAIYHFTWDLEFFGYAPPGTAAEGGWRIFARMIAGSFLFLVGFSLVLAHGKSIRWRSFAIRLAQVGVAALAITIATRFATPDRYIFFGILHCIAVSSVVGLLFLRMPAVLSALAGLAVVLFSASLATPFFDQPLLLWVGLSTLPVLSNDFVPLLPWFGPVLLGIAAARFAVDRNVLPALASSYDGSDRLGRGLTFAGRHSLIVYLIHQPILVGILYAASFVVPATPADPAQAFVVSCERGCSQNNDAEFCIRFCACAVDSLIEQDLLKVLLREGAEAQSRPDVQEIAQLCTEQVIKEVPAN